MDIRIVSVTREALLPFMEYLSEEEQLLVGQSGYFCLGAVGDLGQEEMAAGVLLFCVKRDRAQILNLTVYQELEEIRDALVAEYNRVGKRSGLRGFDRPGADEGPELLVLNMENVEELIPYLTEDIAENIGRVFFHGLAVVDQGIPVAGMVWETRHEQEDADRENHILFLKIDKAEVTDLLFREYEELLRGDKVVRTRVCLPAKGSREEKQILQQRGFSVALSEGDDILTSLEEIAGIPAFSKIKVPDTVKPLKTMSTRDYNMTVRKLNSQGRYGVCRDLMYLPRNYFDNEISCYLEEMGEIGGMLLLHRLPSGKNKVVLMAAMSKEKTAAIPQMIKGAVSLALKLYDPATPVLIDRHNYQSLALSEKLFPEGFGIPVYVGVREEL